ncbi:MAG: hypothetical protein KAS61_04220 [Spirochaetes bacterium]|nr:hypothetical protein [Spirochaetota bacterium]
MKKVYICAFVLVLFFAIHIAGAQTIVRLGDLPKSDYSINIYQVFGFHEGYEGYKLTYRDNQNEPQHLYLPIELRDKYRIYKPQSATGEQHFLIVWKKGEYIKRVEWFMPKAINYDLPNYVVKPFNDNDKAVFEKVVASGELTLDAEISTSEPQIRAPGGE